VLFKATYNQMDVFTPMCLAQRIKNLNLVLHRIDDIGTSGH
jgi:hypothetical protein